VRDEGGVGRRAPADERERARGRLHPVGRRDVVLYQDRDAVEWPAIVAAAELVLQPLRVRVDVRVDLEHRSELGPRAIERLDPAEVRLHEPSDRDLADPELRPELFDRRLVELEAVVHGPRRYPPSTRSREP
jgi:hypothetical protein